MTTCVYSEGVLASDSRMTTGNSLCSGDTTKIYQNKSTVVAFAGAVAPCLRIVDWVLDTGADPDQKPDLSSFEELSFQLIVVDKESKNCWGYEGNELDYVPENSPVAIGSGGAAAMGALHAMKLSKLPMCAKKAIKAATQCDVYTGGKIKTVNLNKKVRKQAKKK